MSNINRVLIVVLMHVGTLAFSQSGPFDQRLTEIRYQLTVLADSAAPGLKEIANFSVSNLSIQSFLRTVAETHRLNIQVDPSLSIFLTNNFTNVPVSDLIYFVCLEYQLDVRFTGSIMSFFRFDPPKLPPPIFVRKPLNIVYTKETGLITFDLVNDTLSSVVREITKLTGRNVVTSGGYEISGRLVKGYMRDLPIETALDQLAYINSLRLTKTKDGILILEPPEAAVSQVPGQTKSNRFQSSSDVVVKDSLITIDVVNSPIMDIIQQASEKLNINFILFSVVTGNTTAKVNNVSYNDLLSFLFQGTGFTYIQKNKVYLIGQRNQEGFRGTELIRLEFRTIEGVDKEIPSDLLKEVELKALKELNAFIITGNKHRIDEIATFLKLIDKPIPNILIEVIVADARKGYSLETGLRAVLSADSVPATQGQVLGGIDLTLSSRSINDVLDKLDSKGIVNLGRVTPKFYATLKAMEKNNNIQVRSTPQLSTMNGNKANLTIGESVYYVEQTQNITGGVSPITTTSQRFNKVEANLAISISPVVSGNDHITLEITAEFSDFIAPTIQNAPPGNATRKFESKIRVRNDEMIILGGLEEISKSETGQGVPLLSRIPVIKWLFSSKSKESVNNRLVVFIRPTLVY